MLIMPKINRHHIRYEPEFVVELGYQEHKVVTNIQRSNATEELYARLENLELAIAAEKLRVRMELELGRDCKELIRGPKKIIEIKKRGRRK